MKNGVQVIRMKLQIKLFILLIFFLCVATGQETSSDITDIKQRLLILPTEIDDEEKSVANEVAGIISDVATSLKRFEIIDRNDLESILAEQSLQLSGIIDDAQVVELGRIASANEALLIRVLNFYQHGVPPEEEKKEEERGFFEEIILTVAKEAIKSAFRPKEKEEDPYYYNIQTTLSVQVKMINIETGKSLDSFTMTTGHTGGNLGRSRAVAMRQLSWQALVKLKGFYTLTSKVISVRGREALLFLGSEMGVKTGALFEILEPDEIKVIDDNEITIPGKRAGIVEVTGASVDANRSSILRNWRPIREGYRALEYQKFPFAFELGYTHNYETPYPYGGLYLGLMGRAIQRSFWGINLRLCMTEDSRNGSDFIPGLSGFGGWRFLRTSLFSFAGRVDLNLDLAFRSDDDNHNVTAAAFSASPILELEILLSETKDLVLGVGYRFGGKSSRWTYTVTPEKDDEDSITKSAVWDNGAPEINISGLFFTFGMKFISF